MNHPSAQRYIIAQGITLTGTPTQSPDTTAIEMLSYNQVSLYVKYNGSASNTMTLRVLLYDGTNWIPWQRLSSTVPYVGNSGNFEITNGAPIPILLDEINADRLKVEAFSASGGTYDVVAYASHS